MGFFYLSFRALSPLESELEVDVSVDDASSEEVMVVVQGDLVASFAGSRGWAAKRGGRNGFYPGQGSAITGEGIIRRPPHL
mmetsp:Transcript_9457/g.24799  ORF Transcript_9457/g.24799 Transcript_9457/m.24799 type:complete len:81 (+) Transcript_9457:1375-1617(+)